MIISLRRCAKHSSLRMDRILNTPWSKKSLLASRICAHKILAENVFRPPASFHFDNDNDILLHGVRTPKSEQCEVMMIAVGNVKWKLQIPHFRFRLFWAIRSQVKIMTLLNTEPNSACFPHTASGRLRLPDA